MAGALIGALRVSLSAETSAFEAGMKRSQRTAQRTASSIQGSFKGVGNVLKASVAGFVSAISVGAIIAIGKAALDYAGSLGEVSQQLGVTTRDLQIFRYAAGQTGVSQSDLETGLGKLTVTLGKVAAGAKAPAKALEAIGLNAQEVARMDTGTAFRAIADALAQVSDRSQRAAIEFTLLGRSGAKLDNLLAGGSNAINELGAAAERLGIILSDEQIRNADKTADKLDAMKTVLQAQIAGVVADNADAILKLAEALGRIAGIAAQAGGGLVSFANAISKNVGAIIQAVDRVMPALGLYIRAMQAVAGLSGGENVRGFGVAGKSVTVALPPAKGGVSRSISPFLAPSKSGGGGRGRKDNSAEEAERKRLEALRDANQFDQEILRAKVDILRAERELAVNFDDRNSISVQILDAEREALVTQLKYEVAAKEKTQAQADQLLALYDQKDALERQKIVAEEAAQAAEESARYQALVMDLDRDLLESRRDLAETASERRQVELEILDFAYRQRKAALDAAIAQEKDAAVLQRLTLERDRMMETYGNDRQGVIQGTRGPMEDYLAGLPTTAAKWTEALEQVRVDGFQALEDGIVDVITGVESLGDAFQKVASQIVADLLRIAIQKAIIAPLANALFPGSGGVAGTPGFAGGGSFNILGRGGVDSNVLSLNGLPIARVSYGERVNISNDNARMMGGMTVNAPITIQGNATRETLDQAASTIRRRVAAATRKGY